MVTCQASFSVLNQLFNLHVYIDSISGALAAVVDILEMHAGEGQRLVEDKAASGMYHTQIKLLTTIVNVVSLEAFLLSIGWYPWNYQHMKN